MEEAEWFQRHVCRYEDITPSADPPFTCQANGAPVKQSCERPRHGVFDTGEDRKIDVRSDSSVIRDSADDILHEEGLYAKQIVSLSPTNWM